CPIVIPRLIKFKFGQNVRGDGPEKHLVKQGTPTMGGIMILLSFLLTSIIFLKSRECILVAFFTLGFGVIGFLDDYIKIAKRRSMGLRAYQKLLLQIVLTLVFLYFMPQGASSIYLPFFNGASFDLGFLYIPFMFIVTLGTVNGVNLTDGLDGLASGVTVLVTTFFIFIALAAGSDISPISGAVVGSLLGFLLFNSYPAKVFMGDTGSLALGGFIAATAMILRVPLFIIIVGLIYLCEDLSVMIQVSYFKLTKGKRFFKMAPIHHHFELIGLSETRVVTLFYVITALMCLIGFLAAKGLYV
ncbi:MAG: phospho-N-acetylmuramoyl-pentapeptide-transferase, partial [Clostridiales bacterium]|nr:phospho-N-acetylmuramoyl-pentapeptide-transferase [Clostridiales bacterium]